MTPDEIRQDREVGTPIRRYTLVHDPEYQSQMLVRPEGKWVKHSDYLTLTAENAALKEQVRELEASLVEIDALDPEDQIYAIGPAATRAQPWRSAMTDLLPCPFCGHEAYNDIETFRVFGQRTGSSFAVACSWCEVSAPGAIELQIAKNEWNTRADLAAEAERQRDEAQAELREVLFDLDARTARLDKVARQRDAARAGALEDAAKVADGWVSAFGGKVIRHTSAQQYAADAVNDVADAIRALIQQPAPTGPSAAELRKEYDDAIDRLNGRKLPAPTISPAETTLPTANERRQRLLGLRPANSPNPDVSWIWSENELLRLRAAFEARHSGSAGTEDLMKVAVEGMRIYLEHAALRAIAEDRG